MKTYVLALSIFLLFFSCDKRKNHKVKTSLIKGVVIARPQSDTLLLVKKTGDLFQNSIKIPIVNGNFSYNLKSNFIEEYAIGFKDEFDKGFFFNNYFFNDKDIIKLTLYPNQNEQDNIIIGGELNTKKEFLRKQGLQRFWSKIDSLYEKNELSSTLQTKVDSIYNELKKWQISKLKTDNSLVGFSMLIDKLLDNKRDKTFNIKEIDRAFKNYKTRFPKHPYTEIAINILNGIKNANVGGYYTDFYSKKNDDQVETISSLISKNKLTLIDLWMNWCEPCILKDKELVPYYEEFKKKGFDMFSVMGVDSKEKFLKTKNKYKYPWQLNYEVKHEFNIWDKYNISNSGGSQFLVDFKGEILAINPKPKEIDSILNSITKIKR
ncbi:AhpC/TSA family protein [Lutibacter sp. Hel_I_33_5]|uniref:peroxiredoxin family protein n=1 Tax=Lutibacter sp. Hel_I_33_5 TaxID=1566289 RepID=UPI0011AA027C|nr:redoxin domain-containing protein [Lutibacter sp. Hel_I_33_5]TVZ56307.1 AhpC/TSA family protein [Lutibacter sp. Hel_I_33_5]